MPRTAHRENDAITAPRLITERLHSFEQGVAEDHENTYLLNMREDFRSVLAGRYVIAKPRER
jgi:hypothetical protein